MIDYIRKSGCTLTRTAFQLVIERPSSKLKTSLYSLIIGLQKAVQVPWSKFFPKISFRWSALASSLIVIMLPVALFAQDMCRIAGLERYRAHTIGNEWYATIDEACLDHIYTHTAAVEREYFGYDTEIDYSGVNPIRMVFTCNFRIKRFTTSSWSDRTVTGNNLCVVGSQEKFGYCSPSPSCEICGPVAGNSSLPSPNPSVSNAGNPVDIAYGAKTDSVTDWTSSRDARFRMDRYYTSNARMAKANGYREFGLGWSSNWNYVRIWSTSLTSKHVVYHTPGGRTVVFDWAANYTPLRVDQGFTSTKLLTTPVTHALEDGSGWKLLLKAYVAQQGYQEAYPFEMSWPDGYKITFERASDGKLLAASDNKSQRAEFTWVSVPGETPRMFDAVTSVSIDADYDGSNFLPDLQISYSYADAETAAFGRVLERVEVEDLASNEIVSDWSYENTVGLGINGEPLLTATYDGRLNGSGQPFKYAEFGYGAADQDTNIARAISTKHAGGDSEFSIETVSGSSSPGGQVKVTNPLGKETNYFYDRVNGIKRATQIDGVATSSCLGTAKSFGYTPNSGAPSGYIYERTERNGAVTTFTRNSRGLVLTKTEDSNGVTPRVTTYTWHAALRLPLTRTTQEMEEAFTYDVDGLLTGYTQKDVLFGSASNGATRSWTYNYTTLASGLKVLASVDGPGLLANGVTDVSGYTYNLDGTMATSTDPNGLVTTYQTYDAQGNVTRLVQPDGVAWTMTYDKEGQLLTTTENADASSANTLTFVYDIIGQMTSYTDGLSQTWDFDYDEARRLKSITNPAGETMAYSHDLAGNITKTEYSDNGSAVQFFEDFSFDELGRLKSTLGAEAQTMAFTYDEEDNLKTAVDAISLTTTNSYDALNRLTQVVDRASGTTLMDHNDADQMTEFTDPRSIDTDFLYNGFGEVVQEVSADRGTISYVYNDRGLVTSMTDARGIVSNYAYDNGGRITARSFPSATSENQQFVYDGTANGSEGEGKITTITDESGSIYREYANGGYINLERRTIEAEVYDTVYGFDAYGRLADTTTPGQLKIGYTYDALDRVSGITVQREVIDPGTGQFPPAQTVISGVTYKPFGPLSGLTYGDSAVHTRSYDSSYRMTGVLDQLGLTDLRDKSYTWTARNNLATASDALDALKTETYQYSAREFLAQATGPYDQLDFTYDAVGNRASRAITGASTVTDIYSYPLTSNRLQSITLGAGGTRSLTYDTAGNVTTDNRNGPSYGYAYNAAGRMESMSLGGVIQAEYIYNALGQQVVRRLGQAGYRIHSVHDADGNRLAEYQIDNTTGVSTLLQEYIWHDGVPVAVVDGQTDEVFLVRTDHIGRPVFATDTSGVKVWEATYLPFGGVHVTTGGPIELRFPGQWFQSESGLHQNWMREYDPTTGRYIQADPLGLVDGASVYGYVSQNPGRYVDPRGEQEHIFQSLGNLTDSRGFSYHDRVLNPPPRNRNHGPLSTPDREHSFPFSYDTEIWNNGQICARSLNPSGAGLDWGYYQCRCLPGTLIDENGIRKHGFYEIGSRIPFLTILGNRPVVVHRFFRQFP